MAEIKNDDPVQTAGGEGRGVESSLKSFKAQVKRLEDEQMEMDSAVKEFVDSLVKAAFASGPTASEIVHEIRAAILKHPLVSAETLKGFAQKLRLSINPEIVDDSAPSSRNGRKEPLAKDPATDEALLSPRQRRDLCALIELVVSIKSDRYADSGQHLAEMVGAGQALGDIIIRLTDLVSQIKEDVWEERRRAIKRIGAILADLEGAEMEFIDSLTVSQEYLHTTSDGFNREMESGIADIAALAGPGRSGNMDSLLETLLDKVTGLRASIHKKKMADAMQLSDLGKKKDAAEHRLDSIHRDYEEFSRQSREMLKEIEELKAVSLTDPLTGAYNRRAYDRQIEKTVEGFRNKSLKTASLLVFDVDLFREVNNNYGHLAGDRILRYVAKLTRESLRADDFLFRYGGDEFVALLPNTPLEAAATVAEKIRRAIDNVEFKLSKSSDTTVKVTISLGVGELEENDTAGGIFSRADAALYKSKGAGRNCVHCQ